MTFEEFSKLVDYNIHYIDTLKCVVFDSKEDGTAPNSYSIKVAKFIIDKVCKYYHMYPQTAIPNMSIVPSNDGITISFIFSEDVILTIDVSNKQTIKYNLLDDRCNKNMSYRQLLIHIPVILREYEYEIKRKYKK